MNIPVNPPPQEIVLPQPPPSPLHRVFLGPNGLRAGWSALLYAFILVALFYLTGTLLRHVLHPDPSRAMTPLFNLALEASEIMPVLIATWVMARIEGRSLISYGYRGRSKASRFGFGLFWGFLAISVLVGALYKSGLCTFAPQTLHGPAIWKFALEWGLAFLLVAVFEESLLRGYLQFTLTRGLGFWWGALILSILFGALHHSNPGESPVGVFAAGAVGLLFCLSLWYTGSLYWAVGFHAAWDWGESYFYGTPDSGYVMKGHLFTEHATGKLLWSGGPTGPEGSLLILPLLLLIALLMWAWWGRKTVSPFAGGAWRPRPVSAPQPSPRSMSDGRPSI